VSDEPEYYEALKNFFTKQQILFGNTRVLNQSLVDKVEHKDEKPVKRAVGQIKASAAKKKKTGPLYDFYYQIKDCKNCPLGSTRTHFVFGAGNPKADLMFIGEAPGRDEDLQGVPFVGRAGQLLTLMLQSIQLDRKDVFIANVLKCRPPNNRDPLAEEIEKCEPYLIKQIELINPKLIVTLGRFAASTLLRSKAALGVLREEMHYYNNVPLVVTYHPAALLRNPQLKRNSWEDLKKIRSFLRENS
jgi:uracil-DNA glycosylase